MVDAMWLLISCSGNLRERSLVAMATAEAWRWSPADYLDLEREWESGGGLANHNVITEKMTLFNNTDTWLTGVHICAISEQILGAYLDTKGGGTGWCGEGATAPGSKTSEHFSIMLNSIETKPRKTGNMDSKESTGWLCERMHRGIRECERVLLPRCYRVSLTRDIYLPFKSFKIPLEICYASFFFLSVTPFKALTQQ